MLITELPEGVGYYIIVSSYILTVALIHLLKNYNLPYCYKD